MKKLRAKFNFCTVRLNDVKRRKMLKLIELLLGFENVLLIFTERGETTAD